MTPPAMLKYTHRELTTIHIHLMNLIGMVESHLKTIDEDIVEKEPEEITHSSQYSSIYPPGICVIEEPVSEVFTRLIVILYDVSGCNIEKITSKVTPKELGIDVIDIFEFVIEIENEYGIEVPRDEVDQFFYYPFSKIVECVEELIKNNKSTIRTINYIEGWNMAILDVSNKKSPKYFPNDDKGADSPEQAEYIRGYIEGYQSTTSHKEG